MKIIVAIDSFKGCLTSVEANRAAAEGIRRACPDVETVQVPVSDGGEGWLDAFQAAWGGTLVDVAVRDPLMRPIVAQYLVKGSTAVIEIARASGLTLLSPDERRPLLASSYGTGQLVADAIHRGCTHIIVGLGGSATSDCGIGMLRAVIDSCGHRANHPSGTPLRGSWDEVAALRSVRFTIATDVTNPLCGENGAAHVFAPQKGATCEMVKMLDARARRFAAVSARHFGYDRQDWPGAGAAGGLGYAFLQYMKADCHSGIDLLLDSLQVGGRSCGEAARFDELLRDASLVVTGEGAADRQTLMGKLPFGILRRAKAVKVPVALLAGSVKDRQQLLAAGFSRVDCINPPGLSAEEAMNPETARRNIALLMEKRCRQMKAGSQKNDDSSEYM